MSLENVDVIWATAVMEMNANFIANSGIISCTRIGVGNLRIKFVPANISTLSGMATAGSNQPVFVTVAGMGMGPNGEFDELDLFLWDFTGVPSDAGVISVVLVKLPTIR